MAKFKAVSQGTQIVLVAGPLVVLSLFFTWQHVEVDYGRAGIAIMSLDGWDVWGLLLAVLVIATVVIVAIRAFSETELSENVPWPTLTFVLGLSAFGVALLKNLAGPGVVVGELRLRRARGRGRGRHVTRLARSPKAAGAPPCPAAARAQVSRLTRSTRSSPGPS